MVHLELAGGAVRRNRLDKILDIDYVLFRTGIILLVSRDLVRAVLLPQLPSVLNLADPQEEPGVDCEPRKLAVQQKFLLILAYKLQAHFSLASWFESSQPKLLRQ